jgi:hypothetical protein
MSGKIIKEIRGLIFAVLVFWALGSCRGAEILYQTDFEKAEVGKVPEEFLVLDGGFAVRQDAGNKFLELPGSPLDSFSAQFGPNEAADISVSGRIYGTGKGRRFPTFGVGLNGVAGYRLQVSPAKQLIEIFKDQTPVGSAHYEWVSGEWLHFRLQVRKVDSGKWLVEGKIWTSAEPEKWLVSFEEKEEPVAGRASIFGSPFSGTPIRFDDLRVERTTSL